MYADVAKIGKLSFFRTLGQKFTFSLLRAVRLMVTNRQSRSIKKMVNSMHVCV